ncbi:hypothetical protein L204_101563 [Cryptococcus depauperatus]|nr:transcriptional activator SPT7 [Cryptococcus depauperatus CBS 7855]
MKYLLNYLEDVSEAPKLSDPSFQQLLVDVQSAKGAIKIAADAFYDSLENIVNELKTSPESIPFQKPVSKRDAPDYYDVIQRPMDLSTILRNIKARKYKNKAEFATDLDQIWKNCYEYNSQESHPLRTAARFMKQKADHHLEFFADRAERTRPVQSILPSLVSTASSSVGPSTLRRSASGTGVDTRSKGERKSVDQDAAGESDDALGEGDAEGEVDGEVLEAERRSQGFRDGGAENGGERRETPSRVTKDSRGRTASVGSSSRQDTRVNGTRRSSSSAKRPPLYFSLDNAPALFRTPHSIPSFSSIALTNPAFTPLNKGKARETLLSCSLPSWYPASEKELEECDDSLLEGHWWGSLMGQEALISGLPAIPLMATPAVSKRKRLKRPAVPPLPNGFVNGVDDTHDSDSPRSSRAYHVPADVPPDKLISVKRLVRRTVQNLDSARQLMHRITEFQRVENEGGVLPSRSLSPPLAEKEAEEKRRIERQENRAVERQAVRERREKGWEVGREEAVHVMRRCAVGMLAHAGFEGANETALDLFTRMGVNHMNGLGKTFRLLIDSFSHKITPEEIILHALHENGQVKPSDLESHLKDEIQREDVRIAEMQRKMRQVFHEIATAPVIEDEMMFAEDGEMMLDGNFADELGEDFLGLRELGIDREHGLSSLTIPQSLFYGRKKRLAESREGAGKPDLLYPPPPPFVSLAASTLNIHIPALLHAFYAARIESGLPLGDNDPFDPLHTQIGSLGQIVVKKKSVDGKGEQKGKSKKREREREEDGEKKKPIKKQIGVGKGNWTRPPKDKTQPKPTEIVPLEEGDVAGEEDAEGEEE